MHIVDTKLGENDDVKREFLHNHDEYDTDARLHLADLLFLRAWDHLRLELNQHDAEEAVEDAQVAHDDDA